MFARSRPLPRLAAASAPGAPAAAPRIACIPLRSSLHSRPMLPAAALSAAAVRHFASTPARLAPGPTVPTSASASVSASAAATGPSTPAPSAQSPPQAPRPHAAIDDTWSPAVVRPYKAKSTVDVLNSIAVFQMCNVPLLVNSAPVLIETAGKVGLAAPLNAFMKATFFKHFCGGEDLNEVLPTMKAFEQAGIGAILDLAMEADLDAASLSGPAARDQAAKIVAMFKQSIDIAAHQPDSFIAVKVTALVPPALLQNWSNTLGLLQSSFTAADADKDGFLDAAQFASLASTFPGIASAPSTAAELFAAADTNNDGRIDWTDVSALFSLSNTQHAARLVRAPIEPVTDVNRLVSAQDMETSALVMKEMDDLCAYTRDKRVKIMIDAEQTYFQPAIDDVALGLCRKWNAPVASPVADAAAANAIRGPLLFNTYQMYLRDALSRLKADTERASRFGYTFGVKIVRGAYMVSERERATELGLADPIQPSLSATHESYNAAIAFLVDQIAKAQSSASVSASSSSSSVKPIAFVVASHNKESVRVASSLMRQHGISPRDGSVGFAQLMGMQDATTHALAANGYKAYKYIPYGPIEVTVPYLHRRAQENSAVLGALGDDKRNLMTELKIRMGLVRTA